MSCVSGFVDPVQPVNQPTRRAFCLGAGALGACGFPADTRERRAPSEAFLAANQPDEAVSDDGFAFGPEDKTGLTLGLRVENPRITKNEKLRYQIAFRNGGSSPVHRVLYSNLRGGWTQTHLIAHRADGTFAIVGKAVYLDYSDDPVSMPIGVDMNVAPGETRARPGAPLVVDAEGEVELYLLFGGRPFFKFEQLSGVVKIEAVP